MAGLYCPRCGRQIAEPAQGQCGHCNKKRPVSGHWPSDELLGQSIDHGKYHVDRVLGRGGFGRVYSARHAMLGDQRFAIKLLQPIHDNAEDAEADFLHEVRVLLDLNHPNIVRCHDVGRMADGRLFIRMEHVPGKGLHRHVKAPDKLLSPARVMHIGAQIADALALAHSRQVLHRDLKPDNILLLKKDEVRVIDFGIAKVATNTHKELSRVIGTPIYMAPEQFSVGASVDGKLDIYQLGAVLHFALTGAPPYASGDNRSIQQDVIAIFQQQIARQGEGSGPRPGDVIESIRHKAPELDALIGRMLATDPDARPTATEAAAALSRMRDAHASGTSTTSLVGSSGLTSSDIIEVNAPTTPMSVPGVTGPTADAQRTVAVLLFENRGQDEDLYLAESISEDLIDVLSMVRGLRVRSRGATKVVCKGTCSARDIGRKLNVSTIVEGSVARRNDKLFIRARVISVDNGFVVWAGRKECEPGDFFNATEDLGRQIAAALTEDGITAERPLMAPAANVTDLYLRARHAMRSQWHQGMDDALGLFEQAIALSPQDPIILADAAVALARHSFLDENGNHVARARELAKKALSLAPNRAEPYYALAQADFIDDKPGDAVIMLRRALQITEAHAEAHDLLGRILLELGPLELGLFHLRRALALDPGQINTRFDLARGCAFKGLWDQANALMDFPAATPFTLLLARFFKTRMGLWVGQPHTPDEPLPEPDERNQHLLTGIEAFNTLQTTGKINMVYMMHVYGALGTIGDGRRKAVILQFLAEMLAYSGEEDGFYQTLSQAQDAGLVDLMWLDHCPVFEPYRQQERFVTFRGALADHVAQILPKEVLCDPVVASA